MPSVLAARPRRLVFSHGKDFVYGDGTEAAADRVAAQLARAYQQDFGIDLGGATGGTPSPL